MKRILFISFIISLTSCTQQKEAHLVLFKENKQIEIKNGVVFYQTTPFNGTLKSFNAINQTNDIATYYQGKKHGEEKKFFLNDSLAEVRYYKNGLKIGIHKSWRKDGSQKFEYPFNDKGYYHGTIKEWYTNGQLVKEFNYVNGKESGTQKMWQSNGNIRANYTVVNGEKFGLIGLKKCYTIDTDENR